MTRRGVSGGYVYQVAGEVSVLLHTGEMLTNSDPEALAALLSGISEVVMCITGKRDMPPKARV